MRVTGRGQGGQEGVTGFMRRRGRQEQGQRGNCTRRLRDASWRDASTEHAIYVDWGNPPF